MERRFFVYLLASRRNGTLYLGVTNSLERRVWEHRNGHGSRFAQRYGVTHLVWYEVHERADEAISREKDIKKWRRAWKLRLIEEMNPGWDDLYPSLNR